MSAAERLHKPDANQARASDPQASAWVSANAGTGKTAVLVKRILRLLLAGSRPESILCLTYTKTAAAEMQNRLLKALAAWATMPAPSLQDELTALTGAAPSDAEIARARRLFAQTLEAPSGLKIYTIHGFCERLLQRFPLESRVTPHFSVLDERDAKLVRGRAFDRVVARAAEQRDTPLGAALDRIVAIAGEISFRQVIDAVLDRRSELDRLVALHGGGKDWATRECSALKRLFGVDETQTEDGLIEELSAVLADAEIDAMIASSDDEKFKAALQTARDATSEDRVAALRQIFCTKNGKPRARPASKAFQNAAPALYATLVDAQTRFCALDLALAQLRCAEASAAALALADAINEAYDRAKREDAVLDYDDLILKTSILLNESGAAAWVLYTIDGGVDHILVDEAQDTNPAQWRIVERLVEEFFAGEGAQERVRTMFAVGDEKQSIYSFQGADPAKFGVFGRKFARKANDAGLLWHEVPLNLSFRSTEPILRAVDSVFAKPPAASGLTWQAGAVVEHHAHRKGQAGLVELWEAEGESKAEEAPAFEPWSDGSADRRSVDVLCERIAKVIKTWIDTGEKLESEDRPVRPGDILILVRRRDPFTTPMIRALKRAGVPVAGADRMRLMEQLAVQDLVALADFLLMPEDDLALAVVLKSPLFGLDDDDLFALAHRRPASLWAALKAKAPTDTSFAEAAERLSQWLSRADLTPPYEFYTDLLEHDGQLMRKRMLTRLGPEAAEALDEFLTAALACDREQAPSLQGFVHQLRSQDIEIKRDMEQDRDEVRIMTVHGAKGLQAPIVFLPDTCMNPRRQGMQIYDLERPAAPPDEVAHIVWPGGTKIIAEIEQAKVVTRDADHEEYHRLLYVAMTRARDRLYVCGWHGERGPEKTCWLELMQDGLGGLLAKVEDADGSPAWRMESKQDVRVDRVAAHEAESVPAPLPEWARTAAPYEPSRRVVSPSQIGLPAPAGAHVMGLEQPPLGPAALAQDNRFARGRLVHALLQHLPQVAPDEQERAAAAFVAARGAELAEEMQEEIVAETLAIVQAPQFSPLFGPSSLAEVPVIARLGDGEGALEIAGQIDRLVIGDDEILILDYKTNRPPPERIEDVAQAYIDQLAAYRAALAELATARALRATLLWTDGPRFMEIPANLLDAAERRMLQSGTRP